MASASQPPKGGDGLLSPLDGSIQFLNLAKDTCGIPPARVVFSSASAVLTMIRVRFPPLCEAQLSADVNLGHNGEQSGLRRARAGLC